MLPLEVLEPKFQRICETIRSEMKRLKVPGAALGVYHDGQEYSAGFGRASVENPLRVTPDTLFQVGSISKTFTGAILMRLAEQGRLSLDTPVRKLLPKFKMSDPEVEKRLTTPHLLTDTGGWLGDYFDTFGDGDDALQKMVKKIRKMLSRFALLLTIFSLLTACNLPQAAPQAAPTVDAGMVGTIAAQTLEAMYTPVPTLTGTPIPTNTPNVTATMTPTITPTYETPSARFEGDTNCRGGPGTAYEIITVARSGQKAEIVGKAEQGNFWLIKNPNGEGTCWVAGDFAKTSGSLHILPTLAAPPTPTAAPPKAPAWKTWTYSCAFAPGGSDATVQLAWSDNAQNEDGYNVYRNDQVAASFGPNTTAYTDVAFVTAGGSLTYVIEVYSAAGRARSSPVTVTCQ